MTRRVIDLPAVRASLARLDAIAIAHPELVASDKDNQAAWEATLREKEENEDGEDHDEEDQKADAGD